MDAFTHRSPYAHFRRMSKYSKLYNEDETTKYRKRRTKHKFVFCYILVYGIKINLLVLSRYSHHNKLTDNLKLKSLKQSIHPSGSITIYWKQHYEKDQLKFKVNLFFP